MPARHTPEPSYTSRINRYIRSIRNPVKREYATEYAAYWLDGGKPPDDPRDLSYMGAQAVRMQVRDIAPGPREEVER